MKFFVVTFGTAKHSEGPYEELLDAYCSCVGVFTDKTKALKEMTTYKDTFISDLIEDYKNAYDDEEDADELIDMIKTYGSETDDYYEIDFVDQLGRHEQCYIHVEEK
jgi:hypothetical protein